jgi:hypothetical protein
MLYVRIEAGDMMRLLVSEEEANALNGRGPALSWLDLLVSLSQPVIVRLINAQRGGPITQQGGDYRDVRAPGTDTNRTM